MNRNTLDRKSEFLLRYKITGIRSSCHTCKYIIDFNCSLKFGGDTQCMCYYGINLWVCDRYEKE